jgi:hypothetical protein
MAESVFTIRFFEYALSLPNDRGKYFKEHQPRECLLKQIEIVHLTLVFAHRNLNVPFREKIHTFVQL